jgi:hypothetical protein
VSTTESHFPPVLCDCSGYEVTEGLLDFLSISAESWESWCDGIAPLGMSVNRYRQFRDSLERIMEKEGLEDWDVRLQGSSARFFSGCHKHMIWTSEAVTDEFLERGRFPPDRILLEEIQDRMRFVWPDEDLRPMQRPFDCFYQLRIHADPSDYDIQVSSASIESRIVDYAVENGLWLEDIRVKSVKYNFFQKRLVEMVAPLLTAWAAMYTDLLQRDVSVAAFPESGPPIVSDEHPELSSHFKDDDWVLLRRPVDG